MENQDDNCCWNLQWDVGHAIMDKVIIISPLFPSLPCPGDRLLRKTKLKNVTDRQLFWIYFLHLILVLPHEKGESWLDWLLKFEWILVSWRPTWMTMDVLTHLPIRGVWRDAEIEILEEPAKYCKMEYKIYSPHFFLLFSSFSKKNKQTKRSEIVKLESSSALFFSFFSIVLFSFIFRHLFNSFMILDSMCDLFCPFPVHTSGTVHISVNVWDWQGGKRAIKQPHTKR